VACVPIVGAIAAYLLGDHRALAPLRLVGIAVGLGGVALLVGHDLGGSGGIPWWSVVQVLLVCVGYATAPFIVARRLSDIPALGVVAVSLAAVALVYAPLAWNARPADGPPAKVWWAVVGLAVVCTGIAFITFFALISEVGPTRATLITFANPAVAIVLGAAVLDEKITPATVAGFFLVLGGCWLATRPDRVLVPRVPETVR
jgi:drug/metabolite transporter (DMT)-like permease